MKDFSCIFKKKNEKKWGNECQQFYKLIGIII